MTALFGYRIESEFPLARIRPAPSHRGVIEVRRAEADPLERSGEIVGWWDEAGAQGGIATCGEELLLWCSVTGAFCFNAGERRITALPVGAPEGWEHRLGSTVLPLMLADTGDLALHAAAIEVDGKALIVCGVSGAGKSTLAAALSLAGRSVLSEDGVVISDLSESPTVWPGLDGVRVSPAALSMLGGDDSPGLDLPGKEICLQGGSPVEPLPAGALIFLEPRTASEMVIEPVEAMVALPALAGHGFCRGWAGLPAMMRRAALLLDRVPAFKVALPAELSSLPEHSETLVGILREAM